MSGQLCVPWSLCLWTRGSRLHCFFLLVCNCFAFKTELSGIPSAIGVRKSEWYCSPVGKMKYFLPIGMTHETRHVTYLWAALVSQFRLFLSRYWRPQVKKIRGIKGDHTFFYYGNVSFYLFLWRDKIRSLQITLFFRKMLAVRNREIKENITFLGHLHFDCQCNCYWCPGAITSEVSQFFALAWKAVKAAWSGGVEGTWNIEL